MQSLRIPVVELAARDTSKGKRPARKGWWDARDLPDGIEDALMKVDVMNIIINLRDGRSLVFEHPEAFHERMALRGKEGFS